MCKLNHHYHTEEDGYYLPGSVSKCHCCNKIIMKYEDYIWREYK